MNRLTRWTAKEISDRVFITYNKAPITLQYKVESKNSLLSSLNNVDEALIGVGDFCNFPFLIFLTSY